MHPEMSLVATSLWNRLGVLYGRAFEGTFSLDGMHSGMPQVATWS